MPSATPLPISATLEIHAPAAEVWAVIGDVARMPQLSPELWRLYVVGRRPVRVGTILVGVNRRGPVLWPTTSRVTRLEEGRVIAWRTRESGATWTYELEPTGPDGHRTRVTGRRDLPRFTLGTTLLGPVIGGAGSHDRELAAGMEATLQRAKALVEGARDARRPAGAP